MSLFGDVVAEGGSQAAAVICYVMAGEGDKAAKLAATVPDLIDVSVWTSSRCAPPQGGRHPSSRSSSPARERRRRPHRRRNTASGRKRSMDTTAYRAAA